MQDQDILWLFDQDQDDFSSGRTSMEQCPAMEAETSRPSSRRLSGLQTRMLPMCLCLKKVDGSTQDASTMRWEDGVWPGGFTMPNGGEFRRDGDGLLLLPTSTGCQQQKFYLEINCGEQPAEKNPTRLSQILEPMPESRYSLSAKACAGILRRAESRGKVLPETLRTALETQSASRSEQESQEGERAS